MNNDLCPTWESVVKGLYLRLHNISFLFAKPISFLKHSYLESIFAGLHLRDLSMSVPLLMNPPNTLWNTIARRLITLANSLTIVIPILCVVNEMLTVYWLLLSPDTNGVRNAVKWLSQWLFWCHSLAATIDYLHCLRSWKTNTKWSVSNSKEIFS